MRTAALLLTLLATPAFSADGKPGTPGAGATDKPRKDYAGKRIDLLYRDASVREVMKYLADAGGVQIVFADDVTGFVTIKVKQIEWDRALDIIARLKKLEVVRDGDVFRVKKAAE